MVNIKQINAKAAAKQLGEAFVAQNTQPGEESYDAAKRIVETIASSNSDSVLDAQGNKQQDEISQLKAQLAAMTKQLSLANQEKDDLKTELKNLKASSGSSADEKTQLQNDLQTANQKAIDLDNALIKANQEKVDAQNSLTKVTKEKNDFEGNLKTANQKILELENKINLSVPGVTQNCPATISDGEKIKLEDAAKKLLSIEKAFTDNRFKFNASEPDALVGSSKRLLKYCQAAEGVRVKTGMTMKTEKYDATKPHAATSLCHDLCKELEHPTDIGPTWVDCGDGE